MFLFKQGTQIKAVQKCARVWLILSTKIFQVHLTSSYSTAFETVYFSFLAQDIPIYPRGIPGRVLILTTCVTGALLFWSYSASLVSFLTFEKIDFPIKSYQVRFFMYCFLCALFLEEIRYATDSNVKTAKLILLTSMSCAIN